MKVQKQEISGQPIEVMRLIHGNSVLLAIKNT